MKVLSILIDIQNPFIQFAMSFFASVGWFFGRYVFGDAEFGISMAILIVIDTVLAGWVASKKGVFDLKIFFRGLMEKIILYALFVSAFWILTNIKTGSSDSPLFWADWIGYSWIAGKELVSIVKHVNFIRPGWVPKFITEKIDSFEKEGKL